METNKGLNLNALPFAYWDIEHQISYIQRRIIVYSLAYYVLDSGIVSDNFYDTLSKQLMELYRTTKKSILIKTRYYYAMADFDNSTGFDIATKLNEEDYDYLLHITRYILSLK